MERKRVNSSRIRAVGYDPKERVLEVEFSDGRVVGYSGDRRGLLTPTLKRGPPGTRPLLAVHHASAARFG